jgi:hypothetical protein
VISTLNAGDSTTLTFQFTSLQTGQVVASYLHFDTSNGTTGSLNFTLGVYANGTPASPDTLVLPSSVDNLPSDVVDAAMRVLGQAWSVATAPAGTLPASVIPTSTTVVTQKALALAEAGLRLSLKETLPDALRDLGTDFFGGSPSGSGVDPGFDQVLRTTPAGQNFVSVLGAELAQTAAQAGGASAYEMQLAQLEASGPNFLTFAVGSGTGAAPVTVTLTDGSGNQITSASPGSSVVSGAIFPLGSASSAPVLGLVTSPTNSPYTLLLTPQASGTADISISIPAGNGTVIRGYVVGQAVVQGQPMQVVADLTNPTNLVLQVDTAANGTFATSVPLTTQPISPAGPTLVSATVIGPQTVSQANPFGQNIVVLFDRIVDGTTSATAANYSIANNSVLSASKQLSGRLVFANTAQPEGPYVPTTLAVSGVADQRAMIGSAASVSLDSLLVDPGAVVTGQVLAPDGTPASAATVTYSNATYDPTCQNNSTVGVAAVPVSSNGSYQFRYVHQDSCGSPFKMSTNDPTTGALRQASTYVRSAGQQIVLNLALLGTGSVTGTVTNLSGQPAYNAQVVAVSSTDPQSGGSTYTDANGNYTISGITVGAVTVRAIQGISAGSSAGNIERAGTTATVNVVLNGGAVNITGTVTQSLGGVVTPVPGEPVVYYINPSPLISEAVGVAITAADGSFSIAGMPTGPYTITAAINTQYTTSQSGVAAAGQNLVIPLQIVVPVTGTVNGKVSLPNGTPAPGVVVYQNQNGVLSNPDGTYSLVGVPVLPSQSQIISARTTDGTRFGQVSVVLGSSSTPVNSANITLSGLGSAQFTVLDFKGNPLGGQVVTLLDGSLGCGGPTQTTNASGVVVFTGLGIGTVTAIAVQSQGALGDLASANAMITQDGATGFATMQFHGAGTVTGSVIDPNSQPVLGAVVQLTSNFPDTTNTCSLVQTVTQSVQTGTTGTFTFTEVNVGKVGVTASQSFYPTQAGAQGTLSPAGATLNFAPLQLANTTSGVLSGTIYLPDGVTPAGAGVQVTANGPLPNVTVNTDANGYFAFAKIFPQGQYTLSAMDPVSGGVNEMQVFLRAGMDMTQNLRLLGTGTINVTVVDGAGVPVSSAFVTLTETSYPFASFSGSLDASNQGVLPFPNVFEGNFSVAATDPFGRAGRTSGTLPQGITSVNAQVQLTTTGTVQGHFYMPDGVTPIPNASIVLTASAGGRAIGQFTTLGTGDIGSYSFQYVPAGPIELMAQDPLTGRTGIAAGTISTQGQLLTLDVKAQGLNTISGLVTSDGAPEPGASVNVVSGTFQAMTTADQHGMYLMTGVPEGVIVVTASLGNGFLSGTASTTVSGDGQSITLNVALRASGTVNGQVLQSDGVTPAATSTVIINVGGVGGGTEMTTTDAQGNFTILNVPAGSGTISAQVLGSIDQASTPIVVNAGTNPIKLILNGIGGISGVALDSSGAPTGGTVYLRGTGAFPYFLTLTAATDGTFSVPQVLAGSFTAQLSVTTNGLTLYGTTTGTVLPNQTLQFNVQLQSSGTVVGLVMRADGVTPAVGANVTIQLSTGGTIGLQVQNDGTFTATGVPLSSFTVQIQDPTTMGLAAVEGLSITSNGQTVNLGTITLDINALSVVSSNPADGATGVAINQPLMVSFSQALSSASGISVMNGSNTVGGISNALSSDGKTVTLQGTLPDGVPLTLNITSQVTDVFGRDLIMPRVIHFTTVDLTPPFVVSIAPANNAVQVPVGTTVAVTFNKALSSTASFANVISVNPGTGPVAGTTALTAQNVLTFTPAAPLMNNSIYSVAVNGATSFGGNVQTNAFTSTFVTPETNMPVLQISSPANGSYVGSATPTISITIGDPLTGINPATATLMLDGQPVTPQVSSSSITFTPTTPLANGPHTLLASVQNNAGITGALSSSFVVDTSVPSSASLSGIVASQTITGLIPISATATDSVSGIASINFLVDGRVQAVLTAPGFSTSFNSAQLPDGPHEFAVQAVDGAGTTGPMSPSVLAYVENHALSVSITSPLANATFKTQVAVTAVPSAPVQKATFSLASQTITVSSAPYQATLSLSGVADGPQIVTVTVTDFVGNTASSTVTINVLQTPPTAPNANLIFAEPPSNSVSLVHGLSGAIGSTGQTVNITDSVSHTTATVTVAPDGSFAGDIVAAIGDTLSLTVTDMVGNVSTATLITVRSTPSLPASSGSTSLMYQGDLVDRVGLTSGSYAPDGQNDAVFTLSLSIGDSTTRTLSSVMLTGNGLVRSTQTGSTPLGVAADVGSVLLNSPSGPVSFPITTGATLTLFAGDNGFIQPGDTYTATATFSDGSTFVGTYTIVAPANAQYVAHSSTITASPSTIVITGSTPSTSTITITNIKDINGTTVPDGAKIALSAASMASVNPAGTPIPSAGGVFTDGTPAANNANFSVYTILNGSVTATYATQPVTPTSITGTLAVIQMQAADASNNVLGTRAVSTQDINIRASTDTAIISVSPGSLYADRGDHRSQVTIVLFDGNGNVLSDGTQAAISVANDGATFGGGCCYVQSAGGGLLNGAASPNGPNYVLGTMAGGKIVLQYSDGGVYQGYNQTTPAVVQVLAVNSSGAISSIAALGTANITLVGASGADIDPSQPSVPQVTPAQPLQVQVVDVHDARGNLVPDGSNIGITSANDGTVFGGGCCYSQSAGGTITDGTPVANNGAMHYYPLVSNGFFATYTTTGSTVAQPGQTATTVLQLAMVDPSGNLLDLNAIAMQNLILVPPSNAVGSAQPASILGDGAAHLSTVTFKPVIDAYGNVIPDGTQLAVSVQNDAALFGGGCCYYQSVGGQIVSGTPSATAGYNLHTVTGGALTITYADQNVTAAVGQQSTANVVLVEVNSSGAIANNYAVGVVPVTIAGLTSAQATASPTSLFANGEDFRSSVTLSNFRDASGNPVPDGTQVAVTAANDGSLFGGGCCYAQSAGGVVIGGTTASFGGGQYQIFTVTNGQVVLQYSAQGVSVASGSQTATVQVVPVTPDGAEIGNYSVASVAIQLIAGGSATFQAAPVDLTANGNSNQSSITFSGLTGDDGVTPIPDGTLLGLSVASDGGIYNGNYIQSVGGTLSSAGTSPGDGTTVPNNSSLTQFTVAGGKVVAVYSDAGVTAGVGQTVQANVVVEPLNATGNYYTNTAFALGTLNLHGITSATGNGPSTLSLSTNTTSSVTFSGIKDSAGNTVPDGTVVAVTALSDGSINNGNYVQSAGGTIVNGASSSTGTGYKVFTTVNGSIAVTYSTAGASTGTANVQILPALPSGAVNGSTSLMGGVWAINVTN